jgi:hypothetical protein
VLGLFGLFGLVDCSGGDLRLPCWWIDWCCSR